jgi:hypothetical protein
MPLKRKVMESNLTKQVRTAHGQLESYIPCLSLQGWMSLPLHLTNNHSKSSQKMLECQDRVEAQAQV